MELHFEWTNHEVCFQLPKESEIWWNIWEFASNKKWDNLLHRKLCTGHPRYDGCVWSWAAENGNRLRCNTNPYVSAWLQNIQNWDHRYQSCSGWPQQILEVFQESIEIWRAGNIWRIPQLLRWTHLLVWDRIQWPGRVRKLPKSSRPSRLQNGIESIGQVFWTRQLWERISIITWITVKIRKSKEWRK